MTIYNSIRKGAYALALSAALWGCGDNTSNNQYDLNNSDIQADVSTPDTKTLETILGDAGVEVGPKEDSYELDASEQDVQTDSDSYVPKEDVLKTDYTQINPDYGLNEDAIEGDYALPDLEENNDINTNDLEDPDTEALPEIEEADGSVWVDLSEEDQVNPSEDVNLEDLLQEDNSQEDVSVNQDTDNCANNHAPTIQAHAEPPSGTTLERMDLITVVIDNVNDPDGDSTDCRAIFTDKNGEEFSRISDFDCKPGRLAPEVAANAQSDEINVEVYAEDKPCGTKSESTSFNYTVNQ